MAKPGPLVAWSQYIAVRFAAMGMSMFDVQWNLHLAGQIGRVIYRLDQRHRQRCQHNIACAFPDFCPQQVADVARRSFEHFMQLVVEVCHTPRQISFSS